MTDAATIAVKLTKAQRDALGAPVWSMMEQYDAGILELIRWGLMEGDYCGHRLTPDGIAVRKAILQEQTK